MDWLNSHHTRFITTEALLNHVNYLKSIPTFQLFDHVDETIQLLRELSDQGEVDAKYFLALICDDLEDSESETLLREAFNSKFVPAVIYYATKMISSGLSDEGIMIFQSTIDDQQYYEGYLYMGNFFEAIGEEERKIDCFVNAIGHVSKEEETQIYLRLLEYYTQQGDEENIKKYRELAKRNDYDNYCLIMAMSMLNQRSSTDDQEKLKDDVMALLHKSNSVLAKYYLHLVFSDPTVNIDEVVQEMEEKISEKYDVEVVTCLISYFHSKGDLKNTLKYAKLADLFKDIIGSRYLAFAYMHGDGVEIDYKKASEYLTKTLSMQHTEETAVTLAELYIQGGYGLEQDLERAILLLQSFESQKETVDKLKMVLSEGQEFKSSKSPREGKQDSSSSDNVVDENGLLSLLAETAAEERSPFIPTLVRNFGIVLIALVVYYLFVSE
eukprot:TRINITY_DN1196_c1_g2_i1.p1 TRINITY_DN1196_c1_g2~~TRINITY_DN1196_c1_g2_i1.p1  ORF type:complete len:450 (+),score=108.31 TRINITY_DN1196_c1_g2_i1:32-1351(+)